MARASKKLPPRRAVVIQHVARPTLDGGLVTIPVEFPDHGPGVLVISPSQAFRLAKWTLSVLQDADIIDLRKAVK